MWILFELRLEKRQEWGAARPLLPLPLYFRGYYLALPYLVDVATNKCVGSSSVPSVGLKPLANEVVLERGGVWR